MTDTIQQHMSSLSDADLLEVLSSKSEEFTPEAIAIAHEVAAQRGGVDRIVEKIRDDRIARIAAVRNLLIVTGEELIARPLSKTTRCEASVSAMRGGLVLHPPHVEYKGTRYQLSDITHLHWFAKEEAYLAPFIRFVDIRAELTVRFASNQSDLTVRFKKRGFNPREHPETEAFFEIYSKLAELTLAQRFMLYAEQMLSTGVISYGYAKFRIDGIVEIASEELPLDDFEWEPFRLRMPAIHLPNKFLPPSIGTMEDNDVLRLIVGIIIQDTAKQPGKE